MGSCPRVDLPWVDPILGEPIFRILSNSKNSTFPDPDASPVRSRSTVRLSGMMGEPPSRTEAPCHHSGHSLIITQVGGDCNTLLVGVGRHLAHFLAIVHASGLPFVSVRLCLGHDKVTVLLPEDFLDCPRPLDTHPSTHFQGYQELSTSNGSELHLSVCRTCFLHSGTVRGVRLQLWRVIQSHRGSQQGPWVH